jgi:tetratricopeptide (TPR) repeat protein
MNFKNRKIFLLIVFSLIYSSVECQSIGPTFEPDNYNDMLREAKDMSNTMERRRESILNNASVYGQESRDAYNRMDWSSYIYYSDKYIESLSYFSNADDIIGMAYDLRGFVYAYKLGDYDKAISNYENAIRFGHKESQVHLNNLTNWLQSQVKY